MFQFKGYMFVTFLAIFVAVLPVEAGQNCNANEEWVENPRCPELTCAQLPNRTLSRASESDVATCLLGNLTLASACQCVPNFARNEHGICVPWQECKRDIPPQVRARPSCPPNEVYVVDPRCPEISCAMLNKTQARSGKGDSSCSHGNLTLPTGCYCAPNFARNKAGICVTAEECKLDIQERARQQCAVNEVYMHDPHCPDISCDKVNNSQVRSGQAPPCSNGTVPLEPGCYCVANFARNKAGKCIPWQECKLDIPPQARARPQCGANERYHAKPKCMETPCDRVPRVNDGQARFSDEECAHNNITLLPACQCVSGFARNKAGKCIPFEECKLDIPPASKAESHCGANEVYVEKPHCPEVSCDVFNKSQAILGDSPCEHSNLTLKSGCQCVANFARNKAGKCVPYEDCKFDIPAAAKAGTQKCPANEHYAEHPKCPEWTCDHIHGKNRAADDLPGECGLPDGWEGVPECRCNRGLVRNKYGVCVSPKDCKKLR